MIQIDIHADLNMVDDEDRNMARLPRDAARITVGSVVVAGRPSFWSWVRIDEITDISVFFHQIDAREAAAQGDLAVAARA